MSNFDFNFMSCLFKFRDFFLPRKNILKEVGISPGSHVLDYGCGRSGLADQLPVARALKYDPAVEGYTELPGASVDLVVCTDVLEHIPEHHLPTVLTEIRSFSDLAVFTVAQKPAYFHLTNGDNCHCTCKPREWWEGVLLTFYKKIDDSSNAWSRH